MALLKYVEDFKTGDRLVNEFPHAPSAGPIRGQCGCGETIHLPRSGRETECAGCGAFYRYAVPPPLRTAAP